MLSSGVKRFIRNCLRSCGLEVAKYNVGTSKMATLHRLLSNNAVDLILDVGANVGQYAVDLRAAGYKNRIVSFEPLSSAHEKLVCVSHRDAKWLVAPRMAIGDLNKEMEINISGNSVSSSILRVLEKHIESAPSSVSVGVERVTVKTLDSIADQYLQGSKKPFLKIDTQGYEAQVLSGALNTLPRLCGLQIELSLVPLYDGQALLFEMIESVTALGFSLYGLVPGFTDSRTGRLLQADGIFFRDTR